jgi:RimJ/RimL family protein N-acetyltransferase
MKHEDSLLDTGCSPPGVKMNEAAVGIRRFQPEDVPALFWAVRESLPQIRRWMAWCGADYSMRDSMDFVLSCGQEWRADRRYNFAIYDRSEQTLLGSVGLSGVNRTHHLANLGYWVRSSRTGRGVASAAVRLAARFAFYELHLKRLELVIAEGNHSSIRVAEKVRAHREGILKSRLWLLGKPANAFMYSLVAED